MKTESEFLGEVFCNLGNLVDLIQETSNDYQTAELKVIQLALEQVQGKIENRANKIGDVK